MIFFLSPLIEKQVQLPSADSFRNFVVGSTEGDGELDHRAFNHVILRDIILIILRMAVRAFRNDARVFGILRTEEEENTASVCERK